MSSAKRSPDLGAVQERGPFAGRRPVEGLEADFALRLARFCWCVVHRGLSGIQARSRPPTRQRTPHGNRGTEPFHSCRQPGTRAEQCPAEGVGWAALMLRKPRLEIGQPPSGRDRARRRVIRLTGSLSARRGMPRVLPNNAWAQHDGGVIVKRVASTHTEGGIRAATSLGRGGLARQPRPRWSGLPRGGPAPQSPLTGTVGIPRSSGRRWPR